MTGRVFVQDSTLREGEQTPGVQLSPDHKVELARALAEAGVDLLDVGFPANGADEQESVRAITRLGLACPVGVSVRPRREELELAIGVGATDVFAIFPFSEIHLERKLRRTAEEARGWIAETARAARSLGLRLHVVGEDASRGSMDLLRGLVAAVNEAAPASLVYCDSLGTALPTETQARIAALRDSLDGSIRLGVHCHNDLGMATANTVIALQAGAQMASVTVNGIGERAGNASLFEVVLASETLLGFGHSILLERAPDLSESVSAATGLFLEAHRPLVGRNAFRHESGIHVEAMLRDPEIYSAVTPERLGRRHEFVLGKHTGRRFIEHLLSGDGAPDPDLVNRVLKRVRVEQARSNPSRVKRLVRGLHALQREMAGISQERFWEIVARCRDEGR